MAKLAVDHGAISDAPPKEDTAQKTVAFFGGDAGKTGLLAQIKSGKEHSPPRLLIYGTEGIGKSTLASKADAPVFLQTEDGLGQIDCERFPLSKTYRDFLEKLKFVATEEHPYQTLVIDSADWLERLIWDQVCERSNVKIIEKAGGGFAKGYQFALDEWREVIALMDTCRARGMAVILLAHAKVERFEDPENPAYDRYSPRLHKHAQALMTEWCDAVLFAKRRMTVRMEGGGFNERGIASPVGAGGGERVLRCTGSPSAVAKNRYAMPDEIPLSWDAVVASISEFMSKV